MVSQAKKAQEAAAAAANNWAVADAVDLYRIASWGDPFFFVNVGRSRGNPRARRCGHDDGPRLDRRGAASARRAIPRADRFQDILRAQVRRINEAFRTAIADANYGNIYRGIYPIKVNQLHEVVDELLDAGRPYGMGLECGSKAELIASLPQVDGDTLLVCNGVKDRTMLSLMISGQRLGSERRAGHRKVLRVRRSQGSRASARDSCRSSAYASGSATRGSGRWSESSGSNSKFGLSVAELMQVVQELEASGQKNKLVLLHCHIGSQIADIQVLKQATKEVAQIYSELVKRGIGLKYLDVGGGLGVNYDKGHFEEDAGINYSLAGIRQRGRLHDQGSLRRQ